MEENTENTEVQGQRLTRARTRRMSLLDTDSRPGTPQLDSVSERGAASPRPTRRTRLNSVTLDVRTPTRSTRASLARGETPEPTTPSSVKRTARTPAKTKSVRQQLTLKEEAEEVESKLVEKSNSRTNTPTPTGEKRVTRSMSQTPPSVRRPSSQPDQNTYPEDKPMRESVDKPQVTENEVKASASIKGHPPKVTVRLEKLKITEQGKDSTVLAGDIKQKRTASPINPLVVEKTNDDDYKKSLPTLHSERSQTGASINNESQASVPIVEPTTDSGSPEPSKNTRIMQPETAYLPILPPEKNDSLEEQEFLDAEESLSVDELHQDERVSDRKDDFQVKEQVLPKPNIAEPKEESPKRKSPIANIETPIEDIADPEEEINPPANLMDVDDEIEVTKIITSSPDQLDGIIPSGEQKKVVGFNSDTEEADVEKKRFPKTPGREKVPSSFNFTPKPVKTDVDQRQNSSTPILKGQESQLALGNRELQPPPLQIDAIKPIDELEKEKEFSLMQPANMSPKKAVSEIIALLNSDEELEEIRAEEKTEKCEFIDNEAEEVPAYYQSGDSMDSAERREIKDNEIHCDGESVGSQDTEDESSNDSHETNDSFVVPDEDVEEDLDPLRYSTNEEDEMEHFESKDKKKRRRILVAESSDDDNKSKEQNTSKLSKPKDQSNCSSDASKLSEAAQMMNGSAEKTSNSETELENSRIVALNELNKSERFNKTATRLDASVLELDSTDQEEEEEHNQTEKGNRSVFEIIDSEEELSGSVDEDVDEDEDQEDAVETKSEEVKEETVGRSTSFHTEKSSKSADEETLLAELASSDLRHLETMFNPLQKSRRQSLIVSGHELAAKEPKLKRRSDRALVGSDFCPSQSFVEMIDEQKRIKNKRKRLSKSFSGAAEDLEEMGGIHHERKRLKSSKEDSTEYLEDHDDPNAEGAPVDHSAGIETSGTNAFRESVIVKESMQTETIPEAIPDKKVDIVAKNVSLKKSPAKDTSFDNSQPKEQHKPTLKAAEDEPIPIVKPSISKLEPSSEPRTAEYYLEYCNNVLQKANEAFRKKKKEDVATRKRQKKQKRPSASAPGKSEQAMSVLALQTGTQTSKPALAITKVQAEKQASKPPPPPKKDLKRLQAARQAVGHAVSLLAPTKIAVKEPRSLARKLSPQPPLKTKKESKKPKKLNLAETSPLKSSDEENHVVRGNRFRTNAGFVTVSRIDSPPRAPIIELIKTSSGIMRVEPATPKQKYFRESPATPRNHGFQEKPASSGHPKKRAKPKALQTTASGKQNPAMQSALRFKEQAFARKF